MPEQLQGAVMQNIQPILQQAQMIIRRTNLEEKIKNGQVIYNLPINRTAPISKDMPVNNITNDSITNFKGLNDVVQTLFT